MRERDHWGDPEVDGSSGSGRGLWGLDELPRDRERWRAVVSMVMNFRVP
jgi:hypothetical protein